MKKNLITVLILAISIINLVFNILLVFVFMPSTTKVNKLITAISTVLDIELASQGGDENSFDISNIETFKVAQGESGVTLVNLASDGSGEIHMVQYGLSINIDKTSEDYAKISESMQTSTAMINEIASDIISEYTYVQVIDVSVKKQIRERILTSLRETFNTECIYSVSFYDWVAN